MTRTAAAMSAAAKTSCSWRTGTRLCALMPTRSGRCQWHGYWARVVDAGLVGRDQCAEFGEWWEQFQPWGVYAENPGPWWAEVNLLWACLVGLGEMPVLTNELTRELYLRRTEVRRYRQGMAWEHEPWPRVTGAPLPPWTSEQWQAKIEECKVRTVGGDHA